MTPGPVDTRDFPIVSDRFVGLVRRINAALAQAIALHNAMEASEGRSPATAGEVAAVIADYLLWKFGAEGRRAFEQQASLFAKARLERFLS
jgi:hypothetical protein